MLSVHGVPLSPFVRKVLLTLEHKGVDYQLNPVFPGASDESFAAISPLRKIPVLQDDDFSIPDTSVICRYIEQKYPQKPIYPSDICLQAKACWLEELADTKLMDACGAIFQERMLKPKILKHEADEARAVHAINELLPPLLNYIESVVPASGYVVGDHLSIADISIMTCFLQAKYGGYEVNGDAYPRLRYYLDTAYNTKLLKNRLASEHQALSNLSLAN